LAPTFALAETGNDDCAHGHASACHCRARFFTMTGFRVGLYDNIVKPRLGADSLMRSSYLTGVAGGVDSLWVPDHLNALLPRSIYDPTHVGAARLVPRIDAYYEPWTALGYVAAKNRLGRLRLGVSVTDASRRNPAVTAQAATTLHHLTRGRAILGIGAGEREGNEPYGVAWTKPVARFEEALATIRTLWNSGGELVSRESEYFPLRDALFDLPPYRGRWPEIWVAAHGPRMLRATGRYADAWFPGFLSRPGQYADGLGSVRTAASDAGRNPDSIAAAGFLNIITGRTAGEVEEALESDLVKAWALNASAELWARHGAKHPLGANFTGAQDNVPQQLDAEAARRAIQQTPTSLLREYLICGTPTEIVDQVAQWRDQGLRYGVVSNASILQRSLRKGLMTTGPLITILRSLRKL
jgi:phthiodiolone/phenolphthiodiolone dimycocerosates ketoreductase